MVICGDETPRVLSIQVGRPRQYGRVGAKKPLERAWTSGIGKQPVAGSLHLGLTNLAGDEQADRENHGGPDKAVLAYAASHYPLWRSDLGQDLPFGAFGENLTVLGLSEETVCIGDVCSLGAARLEVSQPRQPCWKLALRWGIRDLTARVEKTGRTGWYLRVLEEGQVEAGQPLRLLSRPHPEWTVARATRVARNREADPVSAAALASCPALSASWREALA
jgi:MOSC domain-containing protein YiiM